MYLVVLPGGNFALAPGAGMEPKRYRYKAHATNHATATGGAVVPQPANHTALFAPTPVGARVKGYGAGVPTHTCGCPMGTVTELGPGLRVWVLWDGYPTATPHAPHVLKPM
jgi:hypothetical protein